MLIRVVNSINVSIFYFLLSKQQPTLNINFDIDAGQEIPFVENLCGPHQHSSLLHLERRMLVGRQRWSTSFVSLYANKY